MIDRDTKQWKHAYKINAKQYFVDKSCSIWYFLVSCTRVVYIGKLMVEYVIYIYMCIAPSTLLSVQLNIFLLTDATHVQIPLL